MKKFDFDFSNKNILITGGNGGIGYQAANLFSDLGGKLLSPVRQKKV